MSVKLSYAHNSPPCFPSSTFNYPHGFPMRFGSFVFLLVGQGLGQVFLKRGGFTAPQGWASGYPLKRGDPTDFGVECPPEKFGTVTFGFGKAWLPQLPQSLVTGGSAEPPPDRGGGRT